MVLPHSVVGGAETATLRLCLSLRETGRYSPVAFIREPDTAVRPLFDAEGIPTAGYTFAWPSYLHPVPYWRGILALSRLFRAHDIRIVHGADMPAALHAVVAAKLAGIPSVCHIRSNYDDFLARYKLPLACVNHFAFVSRAAWTHFNRIWNVPPHRGEVVYDWAPARDGVPDRNRLRAGLGIPPDAFVIGMVARVAPPKDFDTFLAAAARLALQDSAVRILLVGEAPSEEAGNRLRELIRNLGIAPVTVLAGHRRDARDLMAAMDVHVLCSRQEGFGLVLLEAMAAGTPVIGTRVGGIPEIVTHGVTGLLHGCGDIDDLAAQLAALRSQPELRARLAAAATARVESEFVKERTVAQIEDMYRRLVRA